MKIKVYTALILILAAANIYAQSRTQQLDEVVITGSNDAVGRNLMPYTVTNVDNKQIEASGRQQLLSALSGSVPGLFITERNILGFGLSNGGAGGIKIRGVGGSPTNAVLMMVDGQPQFAGIYSHHVADFYETEYVDHVEVLRGPGSVLYGSNAMGGVINVITKEADSEGIRTTARTQYGSYNTWCSSVTSTTHYGKLSSLISASYDRTDGIENNFDYSQKNLYAKIGYDINDRWMMRADYSLNNSIGNDPVYPRLSNPTATDIYHQNIIRGEASASLSNKYRNTNGNLRVYYSYGNHYIDDPNHFHSLDDRFGIIAYQNFRPWKWSKITIGFDFDTYTGKIPISGGKAHTPGSMATLGRKSITEYSPYITFLNSFLNGRLTFSRGLRMANSDKFGTQWIPQCGFIIHPGGGWTIKASMAKGYRNPSFRELYLYKTANSELSPERMMNYEATISKSFNSLLSIDLTGYYSEGSNMIETVQMRNINTGSFTNKGIEASAVSHPTGKLTLRATYSYLHTSLTNLVAAPKNQIYMSAAWQPTGRIMLDASLRSVGSLYVSEQMKSEDYILCNAKISYTIIAEEEKRDIKTLVLFANMDNITDCDYTINEGYKMPGFNASTGVKLTF